jgi:hypothetical protein
VFSAKKRKLGNPLSRQKLGEVADPPGDRFSEWESFELRTFDGSFPLTTEALVSDQPDADPSNVPPGRGA